MATGLFCFIVAILLYSILMMIRLHYVSEFTRRLLQEESEWLYNHWPEFQDGRREGPYFKRYHRLPAYAVMVHKFWRSISSFEREIGPVERYYPLKK